MRGLQGVAHEELDCRLAAGELSLEAVAPRSGGTVDETRAQLLEQLRKWYSAWHARLDVGLGLTAMLEVTTAFKLNKPAFKRRNFHAALSPFEGK